MTRYSQKPLPEVDEKIFAEHSPLIRRLLLTRGIKNNKDAEAFLNPDWERGTHDPFLMKGMEKTVKRIVDAMEKKETIAIWSDYDMDGIPGAVVLYDFFKIVGYQNVIHYTPHRNIEGFGLNKKGIDEVIEKGAQLIITIDCGMVDVEQVEYINKKGLEAIITDHHLPGKKIPEAYSILNPKQKDCEYPEEMLCGAGVIFKLVQGLLSHLSKLKTTDFKLPANGWEKWLLDMVGMATVADMVPLTGENRVFAFYGIIVLRKSRRPGLQALLRKAMANQRYLTEDDIAFTIAPRINAASRMGHASDAFKLLASNDLSEAGTLANDLNNINNRRKTAVAVMKREIKRRLKKIGEPKSVIVLGNPEWKPSLLGLVASSLAGDFNRPVFLWGRESGKTIKGSCRSDGVCSVHEVMSEASESFMEFGGHAFAGGFSVNEDCIHALESALVEAHAKVAKEKTSSDDKFYDDELLVDDVTWEMYRHVTKLAPFGEGNPKPLFLFRDAVLAGVRTFGKGNEHLELSLKKDNGTLLKAISFFTTTDSFDNEFHPDKKITIVATLEASYFMGRRELRLRLIDVL